MNIYNLKTQRWPRGLIQQSCNLQTLKFFAQGNINIFNENIKIHVHRVVNYMVVIGCGCCYHISRVVLA